MWALQKKADADRITEPLAYSPSDCVQYPSGSRQSSFPFGPCVEVSGGAEMFERAMRLAAPLTIVPSGD